MAIEKMLSNQTRISINESHGVINGQEYHSYGPAYLTAEANDGFGHNYRVFIADAKIKATNPDEAFALAINEFADSLEIAENMDVIEMVKQHGGGEYVADLRGGYVF